MGPQRISGMAAVELPAIHPHPANVHHQAAVRLIPGALQDYSLKAAILGNVQGNKWPNLAAIDTALQSMTWSGY